MTSLTDSPEKQSVSGIQNSSPCVKCLVWDLDETLWEGRILDGASPVLRPQIRTILSALDRRGILHSIASTNEHAHAWDFIHQMGLQDYFLFPQIHMGYKTDSIRDIANHLDIRMAEMAFIDDDPMERDMIKRLFPAVRVYDAAHYQQLLSLPEFQPAFLTSESQSRRQMIQSEIQRTKDESIYHSIEDFLHTCNLRFQGRSAPESGLQRISELAMRTNRMNATGKRFTLKEITDWWRRDNHYILTGSLRDRYGDYGTIAACMLHLKPPVMHGEAIWISCRTGKKGAPAAFFSYAARFAARKGANCLRIQYVRNEHNRLAAFHLRTYGFHAIREDSNLLQFSLNLPDMIRDYPAWMTAEEES